MRGLSSISRALALSTTAVVLGGGVSSSRSSCDDSEASNSLMDQANAARADQKPKIKTPPDFEACKNSFHYAGPSTYDGFRFIVQKQINLSSVVNHFYWTGASQFQGGSFYQYRLILPLNDGATMIDASTTMDMDASVNIKQVINQQYTVGCNMDLKSQQPKSLTLDLNYHDDNCTYQSQYANAGSGSMLGFSLTQAVTPALVLGASMQVSVSKSAVSKALYACLDQDNNVISALYEGNNSFKAMYMRRVNPGRVNVYTDLSRNPKGESEASIGAEYTLKSSKLNFSVDSNLTWKSTLETQILPGCNLNLSGEVSQLADQYKYGMSLQLM